MVQEMEKEREKLTNKKRRREGRTRGKKRETDVIKAECLYLHLTAAYLRLSFIQDKRLKK
jgi:hypothetical protein